jgi:hypothetical protein
MPVEIRELIIKASIAGESGSGGSAAAVPANEVSPGQELFNALIEKIIEIEKDRKER